MSGHYQGAQERSHAPGASGDVAGKASTSNRHSTAPVDRLLPMLHGVKAVGQGRWMARCPAHDDKSPSLSIRETGDGRVLVHCFAGCTATEVLDAVGLSLSDLFERPIGHHLVRAKATFPALPILRALSLEATVIFLCGSAAMAGEPFDRDRLEVALHRIGAGLRVAEGRA